MSTIWQGIVDGWSGAGLAGLVDGGMVDGLVAPLATAGLFVLFGVMAARKTREGGPGSGASCGAGGCDGCESAGGGCGLSAAPNETTSRECGTEVGS